MSSSDSDEGAFKKNSDDDSSSSDDDADAFLAPASNKPVLSDTGTQGSESETGFGDSNSDHDTSGDEDVDAFKKGDDDADVDVPNIVDVTDTIVPQTKIPTPQPLLEEKKTIPKIKTPTPPQEEGKPTPPQETNGEISEKKKAPVQSVDREDVQNRIGKWRKKEINNEVGVILHFGLYSYTAYHNLSYLKRSDGKKGTELYYKRLMYEKGKKMKSESGYKETQAYHQENFPGKTYFDLIEDFNRKTETFNFENLFKQLKMENVTYIILTAKHQDGFCLWPSEHAEHKSKKNFVKEFIGFARRHNPELKVGLCYSWLENGKKFNEEFFKETIKPQINELKKMDPDYWWFCGDQEFKDGRNKSVARKIFQLVNKLKKRAIINSRVPPVPLGNKDKSHDIIIYEQQKMPSQWRSENWEYIFTIGKSWGYCEEQESVDDTDYDKEDFYKTKEDIQKLYKEVASRNGNFLINFGPKLDGSLDENELTVYNDFMNDFNKVPPKKPSKKKME